MSALDDYADALEQLAQLQAHSKNPITRAWAVKHSAEARYLRSGVELQATIERFEYGAIEGLGVVETISDKTEPAVVNIVNEAVTISAPPVSLRAAPLLTANVVEVTATEVVVLVFATAPSWQRMRVQLDVDTHFDFDLSTHGPQVQGKYRYLRPEVSHDQPITVTAMREGGDPMSASTKVWLPQLDDEVPPEG
jgi:hypothetical protein